MVAVAVATLAPVLSTRETLSVWPSSTPVVVPDTASPAAASLAFSTSSPARGPVMETMGGVVSISIAPPRPLAAPARLAALPARSVTTPPFSWAAVTARLAAFSPAATV